MAAALAFVKTLWVIIISPKMDYPYIEIEESIEIDINALSDSGA